jgi:hypothetical protein
MAARTSTQAGNWSATSTWGGAAAPVSGDTANVNHAVTVDTSATVGTSGATGTAAVAVGDAGTLTIATGAVFTVQGDLLTTTHSGGTTVQVKVILQAGATLRFDVPTATTYFLVVGSGAALAGWQSNGSSAQPCVVERIGLGKAAVTYTSTNNGSLTATWTTFRNLGSASVPAIETFLGDNAANAIDLADCTFDTCYRVLTNNLGAATNLSLVRCHWTGTLNSECLNTGCYPGPTGTRTITNCSFDTYANFFPGVIDFTENYFAQTPSFTTGRWLSFTGNLLRYTGSDTFGNTVGDSLGNYWLADTTSSPHYISVGANGAAATIDSDIFELTGSDGAGDCILLGQPSTPTVVTILRCLVLSNGGGNDSGTLFSALGNENITFSAEHCTYYTGVQGAAVGENYNGHAGMLSSFRGNLAWDEPPGGTPRGWKLADVYPDASPADLISSANCDYNGGYNLIAGSNLKGYDHLTFTSGSPGAHDVSGDPQFVDPTRKLASWGTTQGADGSVAGALALIAADPTRIANLIAWVKAGFRPQNAVYSGATYPGDAMTIDAAGNALGGTIGALAYQAAGGGGPGGFPLIGPGGLVG